MVQTNNPRDPDRKFGFTIVKRYYKFKFYNFRGINIIIFLCLLEK